jgi:hypothetical protein
MGDFFARAGIFWAIRQENNLHCGRRVEIWPFGYGPLAQWMKDLMDGKGVEGYGLDAVFKGNTCRGLRVSGSAI